MVDTPPMTHSARIPASHRWKRGLPPLVIAKRSRPRSGRRGACNPGHRLGNRVLAESPGGRVIERLQRLAWSLIGSSGAATGA